MSTNRRPHRILKPHALAIVAPALVAVAVPRPAHALAGGIAGALLSAYAYDKCVEAKRSFCELLLLDPAGQDVTFISVLIRYDPTKMEIDPHAFLFCDFSGSGQCPPIIPAAFGSPQPLAADPGIDLSLATPRPGTAFTFTNDVTTGTLTVTYDLSANPAPGSGPRNFLGIGLYRTPAFASANAVQYFNTPGTYDLTISSASCTTLDGVNQCGSQHPVVGLNFVTSIPEPSTVLLLGSALPSLLGYGWRRRRQGVV